MASARARGKRRIGSSASIFARTARACSQSSRICAASASGVAKVCIGTKKGDELDLDLLPVEVAGKVQQIGFEHRLARAESRARADIAGGRIALAVMVDAHGIDAVAHVLPRREREIERREAEPLAAAGALARRARARATNSRAAPRPPAPRLRGDARGCGSRRTWSRPRPTGATTSTPKPSTRPSAASSAVVPVRPLP